MRGLLKIKWLVVVVVVLEIVFALSRTEAFVSGENLPGPLVILPVPDEHADNNSYFMEISTDPNFLSSKAEWQQVDCTSNPGWCLLSATVPDNGEIFYWRYAADVDGCALNGCPLVPQPPYSYWFTNGPSGPPVAPTLISPDISYADGSAITFYWNSIDGSRTYSYFVEVATNDAFTENFRSSPAIDYRSPTNYPLDGFPNDCTTFYWRVRACNSFNNGTCTLSEPGKFINSTGNGPGIPRLESPESESNIIGTSVSLEWKAATCATSYYLEVGTDPDFAYHIFDEELGDVLSYPGPLDTEAGVKYYWRVGAIDNIGNDSVSDPWNFTISDCAPAVGKGYGDPNPWNLNVWDPFDMCNDGSNFLLKDISRRDAEYYPNDPYGRNGHMNANASISTRNYNDTDVMKNSGNIWSAGSQKSGVDAHANAARVYDYLDRVFGLYSYDGAGSSMISIVEVPVYMDGKTACVNDSYMNPYTSEINYCISSAAIPHSDSSTLDVVAHEWGHAVTANAATVRSGTLARQCESGALNEAFSDWFGVATQWSCGVRNWTIGEGVNIERDLSNPPLSPAPSGPQPDYYGGANWVDTTGCPNSPCIYDGDHCSIHKNSGVPNKMFYLLSVGGTNSYPHNQIYVQPIGIDKAIQIAFKANMEKWTSYVTFPDALNGMIAAAQKLYPTSKNEAYQVQNAWAAVGVGSLPKISLSVSTPQGQSCIGCSVSSDRSDGYYEWGATAIVTATPDPNEYEFVNWKDLVTGEVFTDNPFSFTVSDNRTLVANFTQKTPKIAIDPTSNEFGSVYIGETWPPRTFTVTNAGTPDLLIGTIYKGGANLTDFDITDDNCSGKRLAATERCTFKVEFSPAAEMFSSASIFIPSNDPATPLTVTVSGTGSYLHINTTVTGSGTVSPSSPSDICNGSQTCNIIYNGSQTFNISASAGYHIKDVLVDGVSQGVRTSYPFSNVTDDHTLDAVFESDSTAFTCTASVSGGNGTISPTTANVTWNNRQVFKLWPNTCYHALVSGCNGTLSADGLTYTTAPITSSCAVSASFAINQYTVTPSFDSSKGNMNPSTLQPVNCNGTVTFTVTPNSGYHITSISGCYRTSVGSQPSNTPYSYTTGPITSSCTVTATFANSYTVIPSAGSGGTITPNTSQSVNYNSTATFTVTPNAGNSIASVSGCGGTPVTVQPYNTSYPYTTAPISADCTVSATFVNNTAPSLSEAPASAAAGDTVGVAFSNPTTPPSGDWIGLFAQGANDAAYVARVFDSSCTGGSAVSSGLCQFPMPACMVPGSYEFRLFSGATNARLAVSNPLTVTQGHVKIGTTTSTTTYCSTLQAAYDAVSDGDVIRSQAVVFAENLSINKSKNVSLQGGYDSAYGSYSGNVSYLKGTIQTLPGGGTLTVGNFVILRDTDPLPDISATFTVTPSSGANGTFAPGTAQTVNYNSTTSFTATPRTGYRVTSTNGCGGIPAGPQPGNTSYTHATGPITGNCGVTATFDNTYTINPSAGANGTISPNTPQVVTYNSNPSFTVTPNTGYHIASVTGCAGQLLGNIYTPGAIADDCSIVASFAPDNCTVTPSAGANGTMNPNTSQVVNSNANVLFTITPNAGYYIKSVSGCWGTALSSPLPMNTPYTYTTGAVTDNCVVSATFSNTYKVTPSPGANGTMTPTSAQTIAYNSTTSFTVTPNTGYHITSISGCGGTSVGVQPYNTPYTYTTGAIGSNCSVSATFDINTYTVTPSADVNGGTSPNTPQTVNYNARTSFTVTPNYGYYIASVAGCGGSLSGSTYTTGSISSDCSVAATFAPVPIRITAPNGGENWSAGAVYPITWTYTGNPGTYVKIELYKAGVLNRTIISSTSMGTGGSGSYNWTIPTTQSPGSDYTVKLTSTANTAYTISSASTFTISPPSITIASPNGGESWQVGSTQAITWTYAGNPGSYVKIELYKSGALSSTIASSTAISSGSYGWTLSSTLTPGSDYTVKVTSTTNSAYTSSSNSTFTVAPATISVTAPNGGESWSADAVYPVAWTYNGSPGSYVKIELYKSGALNTTIVSSTSVGTGGSGSYNWTIPATLTPGSDYTVKITSTTNGALSGESNSAFTINPPSITVTSPNGGENWSVGAAYPITWTYTGNPGAYVKIELYKAGVLDKTIITSTSIGTGGSGSYNWTIPSTQTPGSDYTVKVIGTTNSAYTSSSNSAFTINPPSITITSPNGGESWSVGAAYPITWTYAGNPGSYVKIELYKGGVLNRTIISSISVGSGGSGSYNWTIPSTQTPGSDYTIKITSTTNSAYTSSSNNTFTINPPSITITSPNGGENWQVGTAHAITWTYAGNPGSYVKIELYKSGVLNRTITSSISVGSGGSGSYNWTIPSTQAAGSDYTVKVTSTTNSAYTDTNTNSFSIY